MSKNLSINGPLKKKSATRWWGRCWPTLTDLKTAHDAAKQGAYNALIVAGLTALLATLSVLGIWKIVDGSAFVESVIMAVLGILILRLSRVAAVCALLFFIAGRGYGIYLHGFHPAGAAVMVISLVGFVSGVRGTFACRRYRLRWEHRHNLTSLMGSE
jgi:hypothetical protein